MFDPLIIVRRRTKVGWVEGRWVTRSKMRSNNVGHGGCWWFRH
ncbi:hypothetical protein Hanom_Chr09g00826781 [Helianthus anomalus]